MAKKIDKQGFMVYRTWSPIVKSISDEAAGKLFKACMRHQDGEDVVIDDPVLNGVFQMMTRAFDIDAKKYAERCEKNAENGKKGGRPPKSKEPDQEPIEDTKNRTEPKITERFFAEPKKADKEKENEKDNDNENENDNENGEGVVEGMEEGKGIPGEGEKPHPFGDYQNILLTDSEWGSLIKEFGMNVTDNAIYELSNRIHKARGKTEGYKAVRGYLKSEVYA